MAKKARKKKATTSGSTGPISDELRRIIRARGLTAYRVSKDAGLAGADPVQRFLDGTHGLRLETVDKIAIALNLQLSEVEKPKSEEAAMRQ